MASYKEKARAALLDKVHAKNICDDRNAAFCATASALPNGAYGLVLLALNGNTLNICDVDFQNNIGTVLYSVPMAEVSDFKIGRSLFGNTLRFFWIGQKFQFTNIAGLKALLEVIETEVGK